MPLLPTKNLSSEVLMGIQNIPLNQAALAQNEDTGKTQNRVSKIEKKTAYSFKIFFFLPLGRNTAEPSKQFKYITP